MSLRQNVLIVEDSLESVELIQRALGSIAHLEYVSTLREARQRLAQLSEVALVILDLQLPDGDGLELCASLRDSQVRRDTSVVVLSGTTGIDEKLRAFDGGADDYVTKPFSREELRSRIQSRLRKTKNRQDHASNVSLHGVEVDRDRRRTFIRDEFGTREIILTAREFGILSFMISKPGTVFRRKEILFHVWGPNVHTCERLVDTHVSKLKRKMGWAGSHISTVQGFGYRMAAEQNEY